MSITTVTPREAELMAEVAALKAQVHSCGPTCSKAGCINRRLQEQLAVQRKVLEQALEALNDITAEISMKRFWREKDEKRFDEIAEEAITAIQEILKS